MDVVIAGWLYIYSRLIVHDSCWEFAVVVAYTGFKWWFLLYFLEAGASC